MKYIKRIHITIFSFIFLLLIYTFSKIDTVEENIFVNFENIFINQAKEYTQKIKTDIHYHIKDNLYLSLKKDEALRQELEHEYSNLVSSVYQYIYILYRDKKGNYRYLIDASLKDKGEFNQKLNVEKKDWDKVYVTKQPLLIKQDNQYNNLSFTYLAPVIYNDKVEAVIAIDFSNEIFTNIRNIILPLSNSFIYIFILVGILIFLLSIQTLVGYKTKKESITDNLTKAYNRNYLKEFLNKIDINKYQILMLDIDHFKNINDYYGHKAGDYVLAKLSEDIKNEIRNDDVFIRFGGEEFLVFVKKTNTADLGYKVARRLNRKIKSEKFIYDNKTITVTVSIGVNCHPQKFKNIQDAIKYADEMLYIAKRNGRDQVVRDSQDINIYKMQEQKNLNDIKEALENNKIHCYFQPICNAKTKEIVKYEALVRLEDKDGKIINPGFFLENIMHTNVYNDMTKRVLEIVFENIKKHKKQISINLNFSDIIDNTIFEILLKNIKEHKELSPYLIVELLENEKIQNSKQIREKIEILKSFGVQIAIDDFGSGFANYDVFKVLPIDIIKIDGSIIKDIDKSKISLEITKSIVMLTKELNLKVVAEFIDSKEIFEIVKSLDIDEAQGFYLYKPLEKIL